MIITLTLYEMPQHVLQLLEVWLCALRKQSLYLILSLTLPLFMNRFESQMKRFFAKIEK